MTEQEEEAWVARLTRIWRPGQKQDEQFTWGRDSDGDPYLEIPVDDFVILGVQFQRRGNLFSLTWLEDNNEQEKGDPRGLLVCYSHEEYLGHIETKWLLHLRYQQHFVAQWLPRFRKNCWLSACIIEASAHEKSEWIQGFTREELEAWNLKM